MFLVLQFTIHTEMRYSGVCLIFWNQSMNVKETGHVKWFNDEKGFGFISRDNGGPDAFVHYRAIKSASSSSGRKTLVEGQRVEFIVTEGAKGLQAEEVTAV